MTVSTTSKRIFRMSSANHSYHGDQGQIFPKTVKKNQKFQNHGLVFITSKWKVQILLFEVEEHIFSGKCANFGIYHAYILRNIRRKVGSTVENIF